MPLRISEIFGPTVQGEGILIGEPTVFVRAGGCDYRCVWCDSRYAVDTSHRKDWQRMSHHEVWAKIQALSNATPLTVSLSGGNPALQDFGPLIDLGLTHGYTFACETQGSVPQSWFGKLKTLILSPKPPSSGREPDWARLDACLVVGHDAQQIALKIVVFDDADYGFAKSVAKRYPDLPMYLQPGNPDFAASHDVSADDVARRLTWLVDKTLADAWFTPRILPQLHVMMWGNRRGV